jgi:hypothetical protein
LKLHFQQYINTSIHHFVVSPRAGTRHRMYPTFRQAVLAQVEHMDRPWRTPPLTGFRHAVPATEFVRVEWPGAGGFCWAAKVGMHGDLCGVLAADAVRCFGADAAASFRFDAVIGGATAVRPGLPESGPKPPPFCPVFSPLIGWRWYEMCVVVDGPPLAGTALPVVMLLLPPKAREAAAKRGELTDLSRALSAATADADDWWAGLRYDAATRIQMAYRLAVADPTYRLCRERLQHEFDEGMPA